MQCGGNHFPLDFARKQAILRLQRHRNLYAHGLSRGDDELQLPAREIRQADVMNFSGLHRVIEERQRFFDRRVHVGGVELIEVDRINAKACERSIQRTMEPAARQASRVHFLACIEATLRGQHNLVGYVLGAGSKPTADDLLRNAIDVHICRIYQIATGFEERVEDGERIHLRRLGAEVHSSKCNLPDGNTGVS